MSAGNKQDKNGYVRCVLSTKILNIKYKMMMFKLIWETKILLKDFFKLGISLRVVFCLFWFGLVWVLLLFVFQSKFETYL